MELKILALPSGNGKVYSTTDKLADYIKLGYVDTGETIEVEVTDPSKEVVEMLLEDNTVTHLRYKGDNEWRAIAGGSGDVAAENIEWYKASNTEPPVAGFSNDVKQDGNTFFVSSNPYPHDNICVCDKLEGRNKLIYFESEALVANYTDYIFVRSNGHAHDNGDTYLSYCISSRAADGRGLFLNRASTSAATESWRAQDNTAGAAYNNNIDKVGFSVKMFENTLNVEVFSIRGKNKFRKIFVKSAEFEALAGTKNGISVYDLDNTGGVNYSNLYTEDLTVDNLKNIVCLGDSQTLAAYIPHGHGWVEQMMWEKRKEPFIFKNSGVPSDTIALAKARIAADVTPYFIPGIENIVVINLGTNDFDQGADYATVWASLQDLIATLKVAGWKIAVHTIGNLQQPYVDNPEVVNGYITQLNNSIMNSADIDYKIDINTALKDEVTGVTAARYYKKTDGVHFTSTAQKIIAEKTIEAIA